MSSVLRLAAERVPELPAHVTFDVVVPVFNEEVALGRSVRRVVRHLEELPWSFRVTIADNASTDGTEQVGRSLQAADPRRVRYVRLPEKGRGRALKQTWLASDAEVLVYMDVDLSTDLNALLPLVAPLLSGHSDLAIGTRLARGSRTVRGPRREVISRGYNLLLRGTLRARFSDAQCGFKAVRRDVALDLLPLVQDDAWFFDTELLVLAERAGLRIHEVPVDWVDDPDSRVDILRTVRDDLRGIGRLGVALLRGRVPLEEVRARPRQVGMFAVVGVASTLAYGVLFLLLRQVVDAQQANALALGLTAVANTAANRRLTFGVVGPEARVRHHLRGLLVFLVGLGATSGTLALVQPAVDGLAAPLATVLEVVALTLANLAVTVGRFVAMRRWVFRRPQSVRQPVRAHADSRHGT